MSDEPKRLYAVEVTVKVYVVADDYTEAYEVARDAITSGDVDINDSDLEAFQVTAASQIEPEWHDCIPFEGELNCLEHFIERERHERGEAAHARGAGSGGARASTPVIGKREAFP